MKRDNFLRSAVRALLAISVLAAASVTLAQDRFRDMPSPHRVQPQPSESQRTAPIARQLGPTPYPDAAPNNNNIDKAGSTSETQDFGIAPTRQLRPTEQLHGPTPTSIPGGKVVGTRDLAQWMQEQRGRQGKVMLLHAIDSNQYLPNAIPVVPASRGGSFDDSVQREFGRYLEQATDGDRSRLIVTYCAGVQCWGSYNAALRAIQMGYRNVHWYRGGMEAWKQAGLPLSTTQ